MYIFPDGELFVAVTLGEICDLRGLSVGMPGRAQPDKQVTENNTETSTLQTTGFLENMVFLQSENHQQRLLRENPQSEQLVLIIVALPGF